MANLNIPLPDDIRNALPIGEEELQWLLRHTHKP